MRLVEVDPGSQDQQEFFKGVTFWQTIRLGTEVSRNNCRKRSVGRNELGAADKILGRVNLFGLTQKRISARQKRILLVGRVTPVAVACNVDQIASQSDKPPALAL